MRNYEPAKNSLSLSLSLSLSSNKLGCRIEHSPRRDSQHYLDAFGNQHYLDAFDNQILSKLRALCTEADINPNWSSIESAVT